MLLLERVIARISVLMSRAGGVFLLFAALLVSFEILIRKSLLLPFNAGTELSTYALAIGGSWAFAQALLQRAHVRIDVVRRLLPPPLRIALDFLALLALVALGLMITWHAWHTVGTSWRLGARENTPLATPLVIPQALWFWGVAWFTLVAAFETVRAGMALLQGDSVALHRIAAPVGLEEEIEEALAEAAAARSEHRSLAPADPLTGTDAQQGRLDRSV